MSHKQIIPFGVIVSQNLGRSSMPSQSEDLIPYMFDAPTLCMSAECSCACVKHLGTSISDANISSQNMIMLMMPGSQDINVPFSLETSCLWTPTHRQTPVWVHTLSLQNPKVGPWPTIISFSKGLMPNLNSFSLFLFSLFFLKSAAYHHNFWKIIEICREKGFHPKKQVECSSQKPLTQSLIHKTSDLITRSWIAFWAAAITAPHYEQHQLSTVDLDISVW